MKKILPTLLLAFATLSFKALAADVTPPVTTYTQTPASPDGSNGWYVTPVRFDLSSTDLESGVKEIHYQIDGGTWQVVNFTNTLNLVQNPSFEIPGSTDTGIDGWNSTQADSAGTRSQDVTVFAPGFASASLKIDAPGGVWNGVNNEDNFATASPYANMSASVWIKTQGVGGNAYFDIYAIPQSDQTKPILIAESTGITGTNDWTKLSVNFSVNVADAIGVFMDVGFSGAGIAWVDAATISSAAFSATTTVTVGSDSANHTFAFYAVDNIGNIETYSCSSPIKNCSLFKLDQTPPSNWHGSGAIRGLSGSNHELYVYTNVDDITSGLSTNSNKYQYYTENNTTFGRYQNLIACNSPWQTNTWASLQSYPTTSGSDTGYLLTQKTDFCNSNWKVCKIVRFYAEDMAGNAKTKDLCINGPITTPTA